MKAPQDSQASSTPAASMRELRTSVDELREPSQVKPFQLRARLPRRGRTDTPVATTDHLWVVLKCYAGEGENELHAHPHEDHMFLVLSGEAEFSGPNGVITRAQRFSGAMIPSGAQYKFRAVGEEPLVMLRVGTSTAPGRDMHHRVHPDGKYFDPFSSDNKYETVEYYEDRVFE